MPERPPTCCGHRDHGKFGACQTSGCLCLWPIIEHPVITLEEQ